MARRLRLVDSCAYRGCKEGIVKQLTSQHGYTWAYCHRHHVSACYSRMVFNLRIPHYVRRVA